MDSVVAATQALRFNSMRWSNLGKSAVLILEVLLEGSISRKNLENRLGYRQGGASGVLKKLRYEGLVRSDKGVYSLVDDFDEKIQPFLEENSKSIEEIKETHRKDREDYSIRLEAWNRAWEDEAAIQKTAAEEKGSIYYLKVLSNSEARYHRVRLRMVHHYHLLKSGPGNRGDEGLGQKRACA